MKEYLKKLPQEIRDLIAAAGETAHSNNMSVYLVGGFVRDLILGVKNLDLDIVVEGDGIKFAEALCAKLNAGLIRHRRFGTATIVVNKYLKVDIATARCEYYPEPAHLPEVACGILKDDLLRRDFTINAMAMSIDPGDFGRLIDCFGGKRDLAHKKIRILHDLSFIDDPTRILRAIRFEQRYGFKIEPNTFRLLKRANRLKMLKKVQPQRLRDELILILKEGNPLKPLNRIDKLVGFNFISRGLSLTRTTRLFLKSTQAQIKWFERKYPKHRKLDGWLMYLISLLEPLNINKSRLFCRRFALRRGEEKRIVTYKKINPNFIKELKLKSIKPSRIYALLEPLSYEVIILVKARFKNECISEHINNFFGTYNGMRIHISGDDIRNLGLTPGPYYQKIFHRVLNAKLDGLIETKNEELELIKMISPRLK